MHIPGIANLVEEGWRRDSVESRTTEDHSTGRVRKRQHVL